MLGDTIVESKFSWYPHFEWLSRLSINQAKVHRSASYKSSLAIFWPHTVRGSYSCDACYLSRGASGLTTCRVHTTCASDCVPFPKRASYDVRWYTATNHGGAYREPVNWKNKFSQINSIALVPSVQSISYYDSLMRGGVLFDPP